MAVARLRLPFFRTPMSWTPACTPFPMGVSVDDAAAHIRLVMLVNDVSLRNLIPGELAKGFGFLQSKPASAFSPVAVTPDMLGDAWQDSQLHLPLRSWLNDRPFGCLAVAGGIALV